MLLVDVLREDICFGIEVVELTVFVFRTRPCAAKRGSDQTGLVDSGKHVRMSRCVCDVLALFVLEIVAQLPDADVFAFGSLDIGWVEEWLPEVGYGEDEVCPFEGWEETGWVVEISLDHLNSLGGKAFRCL